MANTGSSNRAYAAAHFALELDLNGSMGLFKSIEGGSLKADVMSYTAGNMHGPWRQLGKPKYEDIKVQVGMAMSKPFYAWIEQFFTGNTQRHNGAIVAADFYYTERARRTFSEAMIKELTFPKLDATDKNAAYMTVGMAIEDMQFQVSSGQKVLDGKGMQSQKLWTACNFAFQLDGLEANCKRVSKIDSFTIKQEVVEYHMGGYRAPTKFPGRVDYPNVTFYIPEADAGPFFLRASQDIQQGITNRTNGSLTTYDSGGQTLFTLQFQNADIMSVTPDRLDSSSEEIKMVKVEIYVESMKFQYDAVNASSTGGAATY